MNVKVYFYSIANSIGVVFNLQTALRKHFFILVQRRTIAPRPLAGVTSHAISYRHIISLSSRKTICNGYLDLLPWHLAYSTNISKRHIWEGATFMSAPENTRVASFTPCIASLTITMKLVNDARRRTWTESTMFYTNKLESEKDKP